MKHYVVISADCHAGPELARLPRLPRPAVPRRLRRGARRARRRSSTSAASAVGADDALHRATRSSRRSGSARTRTATASTRSACAAAGTPRSATRSSTTTASPARSCSPGPTPPPARWARRSAPGSTPSPPTDPEHLLAGARAYNRWAAELCQESPRATRRPDRGADPRRPRRRHRRDPARARRGARAAASSSRRSGASTSRTRATSYDPVWAVCEELDLPGAHATRARRARGLRRSAGLDERLRLRDDLVHRATAVVHAAHRRVRALPAAEDGGHRSGQLLGAPTCCGAPT